MSDTTIYLLLGFGIAGAVVLMASLAIIGAALHGAVETVDDE